MSLSWFLMSDGFVGRQLEETKASKAEVDELRRKLSEASRLEEKVSELENKLRLANEKSSQASILSLPFRYFSHGLRRDRKKRESVGEEKNGQRAASTEQRAEKSGYMRVEEREGGREIGALLERQRKSRRGERGRLAEE